MGLFVGVPLIVGVVLIVSGVLKVRTPDDLAGWESLGVPAALRREWLVRAHPWAEIALGVAVAVLGSWLGMIAALGAVGMMLAYTALIWRALRRPEDSSCACFGQAETITRATLARNLWLTALSVFAAALTWANPLVGGAVRQLVAGGTDALAWSLVAVASAVTVAVILVDAAPESGASAVPGTSEVGARGGGGCRGTRLPPSPRWGLRKGPPLVCSLAKSLMGRSSVVIWVCSGMLELAGLLTQ